MSDKKIKNRASEKKALPEICVEQFQNIFRQLPDSILVLGKDGLIKFANKAAEDMFEAREPDSLINTKLDLPIIPGKMTEIEVQKKFDQIVNVEMQVIEIEWQSNPAYLVILKDITKQKLLERISVESELTFLSFAEYTVEGVVLTDEKGIVNIWNRGMEKLTDRKASQTVGKLIWDVIEGIVPHEIDANWNISQAKEIYYALLYQSEQPVKDKTIVIPFSNSSGTTRKAMVTLFSIKTNLGYMVGSIWHPQDS